MDVAREFLGNPDTPATVLHVILLKKYGMEFLYGDEDEPPVDPILLWNTLEEDFRITIPVEVENKLNAVMLACSTDAFFTDEEAFAAICVAIAEGDLGDIVNGNLDQPTVAEMLIGIREVDLNDGDREVTFSPNVRKYILSVLEAEGIDADGEEDPYLEETNIQVAVISECLAALGAPPELVTPASETDFYGLFE